HPRRHPRIRGRGTSRGDAAVAIDHDAAARRSAGTSAPGMSATRVIVNPSAGAGRAASRLAIARSILDDAWPGATWHESRGASHVSELCADAAARGFERVVVAGGDGTVHHAVRALAGTDTALGVLPVGTGNDFAKAAGLPTDFRSA